MASAAPPPVGPPSLRLVPVEAPGARAQRGSWASCAPQPLASGPKHGQGCSQAGRRRQVGVRWRFGLRRASAGGPSLTSACPGGGARRPGPERQLGVLRPPAFGLWPEARPRALAAVVDEQWGGGSATLSLWEPACGSHGPRALRDHTGWSLVRSSRVL